MKPRVPFALLLPALASFGCNVYDPALLTRRDATADITRDGNTDLGPVVDSPAIDAPDTDVALMDAGTDLGTDLGADVSLDARTDLGADVRTDAGADARVDVGVDAGQSCAATLAGGAPCIAPFSGQLWNPDEPRLIAPGALALAVDRLYVSDPGGARVMAYDLSATPAAPTRLVGTGVAGTSLVGATATATQVTNIASIVSLPAGVTLLADPTTHQVLKLQDGRLAPLSLAVSFPTGPFGLAYAPDTRELFIAGDNRIHVVSFDTDGGFGVPTTVAGQACGGSCPGFNGDAMAGTSTAFAFPTGIDVDTSYVYLADRDNCRIRRFRRDDAQHHVETFAGSPDTADRCQLTGDPLDGSTTGFALRRELRLGRVTDVRFGVDGSIYFLDASHCAVIQVVGPPLTTARVVAGARGCGLGAGASVGGLALGRPTALAMSTDRATVFVSDGQLQRVLSIGSTGAGGTPVVAIALAPGQYPAVDEASAALRVGHPSALSLVHDGATMLLAGSTEGRLFRIESGHTRALLGDGTIDPTAGSGDVPAASVPPTWIAGVGGDETHALLGMPGRGLVGDLSGIDGSPTVRRVAGNYTADAIDAGTHDPGGPVLATDGVFDGPAWPFTQGGVTWFGDAHARVWRINSGTAAVFAGSGSVASGDIPDGGTVTATNAAMGSAVGFARDLAGTLYVADPVRNVVWSVTAAGQANIAAGVLDHMAPLADAPNPATALGLAQPVALAFDGADTLFIADAAANRVRALTISTGRMTTVAGSGATSGSPAPSGDYGPARMAVLSQPTALAYLRGQLYVAEGASGRVRVVTLP